MCNSPTYIFDRFGLLDRKKSILDQLRSMYLIPTTGVAIVLDDSDYSNDQFYRPCWGVPALHMDIKVGGVEGISPNHLLTIMESRKYSNLVWLSKSSCETPDIDFTWTLSHEFRHLKQNQTSPALPKATHFLISCLRYIKTESKTDNSIPTELDADLSAWQSCRKVFGIRPSDDYVRSKALSGQRRADDFRILLQHDPEVSYNVIGATIDLLRHERPQLFKAQQDSRKRNVKSFDINHVILELEQVAANVITNKVRL